MIATLFALAVYGSLSAQTPQKRVYIQFVQASNNADTILGSSMSGWYREDSARIISTRMFLKYNTAYYESFGGQNWFSSCGQEFVCIAVIRRVTLTKAKRSAAFILK